MKKNLLLLLLLLALGAVSYYVFFKRNTGLDNESLLQIKDTAAIGRIFLTDMQGRKIDLKRVGDHWTLNDVMDPRKDAIDNLLRALYLQTATQPVPLSAHNNVIKSLSAQATKVQVYDKKGEEMLCFYVGGEGAMNNQSYMLKEGAKRPYYYRLPNMDGYISYFYFMRVDEWKTKLIIDYKSNDLQRVAIDYKLFPEYSFYIEKKNGQLTSNIPNYNPTKASDYFRFFEKIPCIGFENAVTNKDSLDFQLVKMCELTIESMSRKSKKIAFYYVPPNKRTKGVVKIKGQAFDVDLLYAYDGKDLMTFYVSALKKILLLNKDFQ